VFHAARSVSHVLAKCHVGLPHNASYNGSLVGPQVAVGKNILIDFKCDNEGLPSIVDIVDSGSCGWSLC
jgi:hypothetical protein